MESAVVDEPADVLAQLLAAGEAADDSRRRMVQALAIFFRSSEQTANLGYSYPIGLPPLFLETRCYCETFASANDSQLRYSRDPSSRPG